MIDCPTRIRIDADRFMQKQYSDEPACRLAPSRQAIRRFITSTSALYTRTHNRPDGLNPNGRRECLISTFLYAAAQSTSIITWLPAAWPAKPPPLVPSPTSCRWE
ncbi:hypothetical protein FOZ63_019168 [Perkinsus olseni]|uniref:Uncharacterized protein n=1 Tax=Perkinsus olseni TaxID=32597 RepID=A0A7J6NCK1_PEROL|nr:hypothetical protein FOZ60_011928 [Perkinsus olseni]KAF4743304.1 hypothetical protein FOZ63_019168 [Perkinsus olseni]